MIRVGRPINGISINGLEFLLEEDGSEMLFSSKIQAETFLEHSGIKVVDLDYFVFQEKINEDWVTI